MKSRRSQLIQYIRSSEGILNVCLLNFACAIGNTLRFFTRGSTCWPMTFVFLGFAGLEFRFFLRALERERRKAQARKDAQELEFS